MAWQRSPSSDLRKKFARTAVELIKDTQQPCPVDMRPRRDTGLWRPALDHSRCHADRGGTGRHGHRNVRAQVAE